MAEQLAQPKTPDQLADYALEAVGIDNVDPADPASVEALDERADEVVRRVQHSKDLEDALVGRAHQLVAAEANGGLDERQRQQLGALLKLQERAQAAEEKKNADDEDDSQTGSQEPQQADDEDNEPAAESSQPQGTGAAEARRRGKKKNKATGKAGSAAVQGATAQGGQPAPGKPKPRGSSAQPPTPPTPPPAPSRPNTAPGTPSRPETHKRGGETLPKEVVEWAKVQRELGLLKAPSAERLLAIYNAVRRSAKWDDDVKKWRHVKSFTWVLDRSGKWTSKEELEDFEPPRPNGKVWTEQGVNDLISEVVRLSEPREHIVTDPQVRARYEEVMRAKFLSPAHTDRAREEAKHDMFQSAVRNAHARGLTGDEAIAAANRDLYDVAYNAIKNRAKADGKSDSDAEEIARKTTPRDYSYESPAGEGLLEWETDVPVEGLRRVDYAKVQVTVEDRLRNVRSGGDYSTAYGALSDLLSMSRPEDMKAILAKIVGGHSKDAEQELTDLVNAAQISGSRRRAGHIKEETLKFLPALMKQFDKSREGIWHDNVSFETREYIFAQYQELTGNKIIQSWDPKSVRWSPTGQVDLRTARIINYDAVQMGEALATAKFGVLAAANLHDDLIALHDEQRRRGFMWMNSALASLPTAGVRQFGVRVGGHLQEQILGSQLEQMNNSGFSPNRYGYRNNYLNYLNVLTQEDMQGAHARAAWTTQEGWWAYVNHGPGTGDSEVDEARRQRERVAQEEVKKAAAARRTYYDGIWQSRSIQTTMPQWYLGRRPAPRSRSGRP